MSDEILPPASISGERVSIVFESNGTIGVNTKGKEGHSFSIYLEGLKRNTKDVSSDEMTTCEFYACKFFEMIHNQMKIIGALDPKGPTKN